LCGYVCLATEHSSSGFKYAYFNQHSNPPIANPDLDPSGDGGTNRYALSHQHSDPN
jgi:hypothetical protein